jgi:hypothetical protein
MFTRLISEARMNILKALSVATLLLYFAVSARADAPNKSFEERLREAVEAQTKKNQAEEQEQKRLASAFAAKRSALREQEEVKARQSELAFKQKRQLLDQEQATRQRQLEARVENNGDQLAKAVATLQAQMAATAVDSENRFLQARKEFSRKLQAKVAKELAKAEAQREQMKQMALTVAMSYFTGGAAIPALASSGVANRVTRATKAEPVRTATSARGVSHLPPSANRFATFVAEQPNATHAKTGLPVNADHLGISGKRTDPTLGLMSDSGRIDPDWFDPVGFLFAEGIQTARSLRSVVVNRLGMFKILSSPSRLPATTPVGRRTPMQSIIDRTPHNPQMSVPAGKPLNMSEVIGGRLYSGHALDRMAGRGLVPSVVENTIKYGGKNLGTEPGTVLFFDPKNKVSVVIDALTGRVITVK